MPVDIEIVGSDLLPAGWWRAGSAPIERCDEPPRWARFIEATVAGEPFGGPIAAAATGPVRPEAEQNPCSETVLFEPVLLPLLTAAGRALERRLARRSLAPGVAAAARQCRRDLAGRLSRTIARTLLVELDRRRASDPDFDPAGRRHLDALLQHYASPVGLAELLVRLPLLARLLAVQCLNHVASVAELAERLTADLPAITVQLCQDGASGAVAGFTLGAGDVHCGGRTVAVVSFTDGRQVMYKPRSGEVSAHLQPLFSWFGSQLPELAPRLPRTLLGDGYCWEEHVPALPCSDLAAVQRFYRREGALLALLHVLGGTDMHCENVVAHGDQPVIVDVETAFHIQLRSPAYQDPATVALAESVLRVGLLPLMLEGQHGRIDVSGCGGGGQNVIPLAMPVIEALGTDAMRLSRRPMPGEPRPNRPELAGQRMGPDGFLSDVITGFRAGYEVLRRDPDRVRWLAAACAGDQVRVIARHTYLYAAVLDESTHPDLLADVATRQAFLCRIAELAPDPQLNPLLAAELADLWNHDVPMLVSRPASRVIQPANSLGSSCVVAESALERLAGVLDRLSDRHRRDQEWVIRAALATRAPAVVHRSESGSAVVGAEDADSGRLVAQACAIADQLGAAAQHGRGRANWFGLEPADGRHWSLAPLGAGLGDGYLGVALFLVALSRQTGMPRYAELAARALSGLPDLVKRWLADEAAATLIGGGAMDGLGGITWAVAQLSHASDGLLPDGLLTDLLMLCGRLMADDRPPSGGAECGDVAGGLAGLAVTMQSIARSALAPAITTEASRIAAWAVEQLRPGGTRAVSGGALHGAAGAAWARQLAGLGGWQPSLSGRDVSWCSGLSGRLAIAPTPPPAAVRALTGQPPLRHHAVCHGELGVLEALLALSRHGDSRAAQALRRRSAALLGALAAGGPRCATPSELQTPGFLHGLAGIGYGLLRLADPIRVPSVLLFEPAAVRSSEVHESKSHVT